MGVIRRGPAVDQDRVYLNVPYVGMEQDYEYDGSAPDERGHYGDYGKLPNHITFSTESGHGGRYLGGKWVYPGDGSWRYDSREPMFVPSGFNLDMQGERYDDNPWNVYASYSDSTGEKVLMPEYDAGGPVRYYHNDNRGKNQYISGNHFYRTDIGSYGREAAPFIEEKVYPYGPVWRGANRDIRQEVTGSVYNRRYSEGMGVLPNIVANVLGLPTGRLESRRRVVNTYSPQGNLKRVVVREYDSEKPLGQRRSREVYEYEDHGARMFAPEFNLWKRDNAQDVLNRNYGQERMDYGGEPDTFETTDYDEYLRRKKAYSDSLMNYNAAVDFEKLKRLPDGTNEKQKAAERYVKNYYDYLGYINFDDYPADIVKASFSDQNDQETKSGAYKYKKGLKGGEDYVYDANSGTKTEYTVTQAGDIKMKPKQKVEFHEKPKTQVYEVTREVKYPNTDDAQIWRILINNNEYNLNPNEAEFEQYKEARYKGINQNVTDADMDAWNKRFSISPFKKEMTEDEAKEYERQGYSVKRIE